MEITIKHFDGQFPSFNIILSSKPGAEPFLEIKGCKIASGANGGFISYPARKQENGKWWSHVYGSEKFNAAVLEKVKASRPAPVQSRRQTPVPQEDDSDVPF